MFNTKSSLIAGCFSLLILQSCTFQIAPARLNDDGYNNFVNNLKLDTESTVTIAKNDIAEDGSIYEIDSGFIGSICQKQDKILLVLWAPWCSHCLYNLPNEIKHAKEANIKLVLISTNYDIVSIKKMYKKYAYAGNIYILKSKLYSSLEGEKIKKFSNQLYKEERNISSIPQSFYYKKNSLIYTCVGTPDYSQLK